MPRPEGLDVEYRRSMFHRLSLFYFLVAWSILGATAYVFMKRDEDEHRQEAGNEERKVRGTEPGLTGNTNSVLITTTSSNITLGQLQVRNDILKLTRTVNPDLLSPNQK